MRISQGGFTLVELLVVVLIIAVLASISLPQYFKVVEKGRAAEALNELDILHGAQDRYLGSTGSYCTASWTSCTGFDITVNTLKYFTVGDPSAGAGTPSWKVTLARAAPVPSGYGAYTIVYDLEPAAAPTLTCASSPNNCQNDLMPQ